MTTTRSLKVFLGSSLSEFEDERIRISDAISQDITRLFELDGIVIQFLKCESIHEGNDGTPNQDKFDEMLRRCDISLFIFKDKVGEYTLHEYETARALQKEKNHKIYVYCLREGKANKSGLLTPFLKRLNEDGVLCKECDNLTDLKYQFAKELLMNLGARYGETVRAAGEVKKSGEALFEQCQQSLQLMHQEIEKLLTQIDPIMNDADTPISSRIMQVIDIYQKADLWATKTDYDKEKYSHLLFDYAQFLDKYGMYYDAENVYLRQIPLAEESYDTDHEYAASLYNKIGGVYMKLGDYPKALDYIEKALAIDNKIFDRDHSNISASYNNIGSVYYYQGDYSQALEYYMKALEIDEKDLGKEHPSTAIDYNNIGGVYYEQGDYPKALEYYGKALAIHEKVLGKDHPSTATTYTNIGEVYGNQCNYPQALEYHQKALAIREKVLGKDHPDTANDYNNIGGVYDAQGDYPQALEYYGKALAIKEKVLGKDHPSTATTYTNIGSLYYQWGKYPEALEYLEKALVIFKTKLGDDHPNTQTVQEWIIATRVSMEKKESFWKQLMTKGTKSDK